MIAAVCLLLLSTSPEITEVLRGIDDVPVVQKELSAAALWATIDDVTRSPISRSRAVRLLPSLVAVDERAAADARLVALIVETTPPALAFDVAIARFEIAAQTSAAAAVSVARTAEASALVPVRQAAALMWWRLGGVVGRIALQRCAEREPLAAVRATCIGRLRGPVSTPATGAISDVLHETSDGDPPTSPGRQLRRSADVPEQR